MNNGLYEKLALLQWLLHKQQLRGWAAGGPMANTVRGQGRILAVLKLRDGVSTKDLSYLLGVAVSSLNELLSKLEKNGYISREPSEQDKRVMLVWLTEKGREAEQPETVDFEGIFSCLTSEEQETLGGYLDRVADSLRQTLGFDDEEEMERLQTVLDHFGGAIGGGLHGAFHRHFGAMHDHRRGGRRFRRVFEQRRRDWR
ncbi:MAG: MarR family transcriptional regulator [Gracilibacteraceae bacterium]|jgi:DNA-binding MarR family transcriptional regulator|nr:MarR family transcriptional regulator [Gracilibacteraceae bacterium]